MVSELAIYRVGKLIAHFASRVKYYLQNDMHGNLTQHHYVVYIKFPSGSCKLGKMENVEYLTYF